MTFILPQNTVFYKLERAIKLYRRMAQSYIDSAGFDVSLNQLILLIQLSTNPSSTQVELAGHIFKDYASVARMVDLLVKKGYLTRTENQEDRRKKDLSPTAKCEDMLDKVKSVMTGYRHQALIGIDEKSQKLLSEILDKFSHNCESAVDGININFKGSMAS